MRRSYDSSLIGRLVVVGSSMTCHGYSGSSRRAVVPMSNRESITAPGHTTYYTDEYYAAKWKEEPPEDDPYSESASTLRTLTNTGSLKSNTSPTREKDTSDTSDTSCTKPDWHDYMATGDWLEGHHFPPLQFMVDGIVPEGLGVMVAPPKSGKSWMSLGFCLAVCTGGVALGCLRVMKRPAVYYALEDGHRRMRERLKELLDGQPIPSEFRYFTGSLPPDLVMDSVDEWLEENGQGLVIMDTLGKVRPPAYKGESEYDRDYRFGSKLKSLCEKYPGTAILIVHHTRKASGDEDWMNSVLGSQGINGSADYTIGLFRQRGNDDATLRVTGRDIEDSEHVVVFDGSAWRLKGGSLAASSRAAIETRKTDDLGDLSSQIVRYVNTHPQGVTTTMVSEALGIDKSRVNKYLNRFAKRGRIRHIERGLYGPTADLVHEVSEVSEVSYSQVSTDNNSRQAMSEVSDQPDIFSLEGE